MMPKTFRLTPRHAKRGLAFLGLSAFVVGTGSLAAYRHYFRRPGELATNQIPADALAVITIDTNPAPDQVALYKRMQETIKASGLSEQMEDFLNSMTGSDAPVPGAANKANKDEGGKITLLHEVRPFISDNYAVALYQKTAKDMDALVYIAVTDRAKIEELLAKNGEKKNFRSASYYQLTKEKLCAQLRENYLVLSDAPESFVWADAVRMSRQRSVATLSEYQEARAALPADASLLVFVSPKGMRTLQQTGSQLVPGKSSLTNVSSLKSMKWMGFAATVKETGLAFDYRVPMDATTAPYLKTLAQIAAANPETLRRLPGGAYSIFTLSQPGKYFDIFREAMAADKKSQKDIQKGLADIQKETGLSVVNDIVPAFNGEMTIALYPDANHANGIMDALLYVSDGNAANPAALADKVRLWVEKESGKEKKSETIRFVSKKENEVTYWYLDAHSQKIFTNAINGADPTQKPNANKPHSKPIRFDAAPAAVENETKPYLDEKTIAFAQVGKGFLLATSKKMLNEAVSTCTKGNGSLSEDKGYAAMEGSLVPGAQNYGMIHLGHIMERLQPELEKQFKGDDAETAKDVLAVFGSSDAGIAMSSRYDGKVMEGSMLLPLNYDALIRVISAFSKKATAKPDANVTHAAIPAFGSAAN